MNTNMEKKTEMEKKFVEFFSIPNMKKTQYPVRTSFKMYYLTDHSFQEFLHYLKIVSSPVFGVETLKLRVFGKSVYIVISAEEEDLKIWYTNAERIKDFFKEYGD